MTRLAPAVDSARVAFGRALAYWREHVKGWTKGQLHMQLGISYQALVRLEDGRAAVPGPVLDRLAELGFIQPAQSGVRNAP